MIIIDDCFPCVISNFRVQEYNWYFDNIPDCVSYSYYGYYDKWKKTYSEIYPEFDGKVKHYREYVYKNELHYGIFINNAFQLLGQKGSRKFPFVFTLYPGGGFHLNSEETDRKLKYVFSHPNFKKVIVTQKATLDYLVKKGLAKNKIEYKYGGVLFTGFKEFKKSLYNRDKETFDICFVANKYGAFGESKGYGTFVEVAKSFKEKNIKFHVVGPYTKGLIDVGSADVTFYGLKYNDFFPEFYSKMDLILSPNVPFQFNSGRFDGFPTGCAVEAGVCGVAVFCTDPLGMNEQFENNKNIVLIPTDAAVIKKSIDFYYQNPDELYSLAARGKNKFREIFSVQNQLEYRKNILKEFL